MTSKRKKTLRKKARPRSRSARIARMLASVDDDLFGLAKQEPQGEARWNRPRKQRLTLRVDYEVVDWFKAKGPGYQTRMAGILRHVMVEGKRREKKG
jgi:uncharacterized protein (DUF4415 family)